MCREPRRNAGLFYALLTLEVSVDSKNCPYPSFEKSKMDPTETLRELRTRIFYAQAQLEGREFPEEVDPDENLQRIVELFEALDTWLSRSGFLPEQWTTSRRIGW